MLGVPHSSEQGRLRLSPTMAMHPHQHPHPSLYRQDMADPRHDRERVGVACQWWGTIFF